MRKRRRRPDWVKELAEHFMKRLLELAEENARDPRLGRRYTELALKVSKKYNIRIPDRFKRRICKRCHSLLIPGLNAKVRVSKSDKTVLWICGECGYVKRFGYAKEKSKKNKTNRENREKRSNSWGDNGDKQTPRYKGINKNKDLKK